MVERFTRWLENYSEFKEGELRAILVIIANIRPTRMGLTLSLAIIINQRLMLEMMVVRVCLL